MLLSRRIYLLVPLLSLLLFFLQQNFRAYKIGLINQYHFDSTRSRLESPDIIENNFHAHKNYAKAMTSNNPLPLCHRKMTRATVRQLQAANTGNKWLWVDESILSSVRHARAPPFSPITPPFVFPPGMITTGDDTDDEDIPVLDIGPKLTPLTPTNTHTTRKEMKGRKILHWSWEDLAEEERKKPEEKRKTENRLKRKRAWGGLWKKMTKKRKGKKIAVVRELEDREMMEAKQTREREEDLCSERKMEQIARELWS